MMTMAPTARQAKIYVAVIGGASAGESVLDQAQEVGRELARRGAVLLCGGRGGVMQAAAQGATEKGGVAIGILPGPDRRGANPFLTYSLPTNLGHARNIVIAQSAHGLIAVGGGYGTISEAAVGLKLQKPVVGFLTDWSLTGMLTAASPQEAVELVLEQLDHDHL